MWSRAPAQGPLPVIPLRGAAHRGGASAPGIEAVTRASLEAGSVVCCLPSGSEVSPSHEPWTVAGWDSRSVWIGRYGRPARHSHAVAGSAPPAVRSACLDAPSGGYVAATVTRLACSDPSAHGQGAPKRSAHGTSGPQRVRRASGITAPAAGAGHGLRAPAPARLAGHLWPGRLAGCPVRRGEVMAPGSAGCGRAG